MARDRRFYESVRGKVVLAMLLVALIPAVIIGGLSWASLSAAKEQAGDSVAESRISLEQGVVAGNLAATCAGVSREVYAEIEGLMAGVFQLVASPSIGELVTGADNAAAVTRYLTTFAFLNDWYREVSVTDERGLVLASTNPAVDIGTDLSQEPWWGRIALDIEMLPEDEAVGLVVGVPVPDPATPLDLLSPAGYVKLTLALPSADFQGFAEQVEQGRLSVFYGTRLISDSDDTGRPFQDEIELTDAERQVLGKVRASGPAGLTDLDSIETISGYLVEEDTITAYHRTSLQGLGDAVTMLVSGLLPHVDHEELPLFLFVLEQPAEAAFSSLKSLETLEQDLDETTTDVIIIILVILAVVVTASVAVALAVSRGITRPVSELKEVAEKVSMGDLDVAIRVKSKDEIGELAESFDRMVTAYRFVAQERDEDGGARN